MLSKARIAELEDMESRILVQQINFVKQILFKTWKYVVPVELR